MKKNYLLLAFLVLSLSFSQGEIRNGYTLGISSARASLMSLRIMLDQKEITAAQRRKVLANIREVSGYVVCYELTETLLSQFKLVSLKLYYEIDTIKDRRGQPTDVYVKFIPEDQATILPVRGVTNVAQSDGDRDAYWSEYGQYSVSVKVCIGANALEILAHEFGHVKYQVPHLRSYLVYYEATYFRAIYDKNCIGHEGNDASGWSADAFARRYRQDSFTIRKNGSNKLQSPMALMEHIQRAIQLEKFGTDRITFL